MHAPQGLGFGPDWGLIADEIATKEATGKEKRDVRGAVKQGSGKVSHEGIIRDTATYSRGPNGSEIFGMPAKVAIPVALILGYVLLKG